MSVPVLVAEASRRAERLGFTASCEDPAGPMLAVLAAAVPRNGRILELGTGSGVGTAWLVSGLTDRDDVTVTTVELDADLVKAVSEASWPSFVTFVEGDAGEVLPTLGRFDLIFADAVAGKWTGLELTLNALAPGAVLLVDDMSPALYPDPEHQAIVRRVERSLADDPRLISVRIPAGTHLTLATRRY
ncbi:O-methyltransferase [Actinoplanes utahensis]|uniref:Methyltransferase n=1 Tax=Actinoplanes utahensis TaxID=1869 RepID=A0A0A6UBC4_ACTUT|nr:class I SAM-dependent methyltransferase [Actinoplanes utahensis]KHD73320.1 hypothetical protein MB27_35480 [Actinoplanes utahensis]